MLSVHTPYLVKQPIPTSVLFLNMAVMLILILQVKYDKFCVGKWLKIDCIMKGSILLRIYLRFGLFKILLLTRV